jgi:autotransporter-associated beta strand protein
MTNNITPVNTYTGGTILNQGGITLGDGATLGTGALQVNNTNTSGPGTDAVLTLATGSDLTVGSLSGSIAAPTSGTNTATIQTQSGRTFTVNQTADGIYGGVISGAGNFTLGAASTHSLTLSGTNTYSGTTTVSAGTLYVAGALTSSAVTVGASGAIGRNDNTLGGGILGNGLSIEAGGKLDLTGATLGPNSTDILSLTGGSLTLGALTFQDLLGWDWLNAAQGTYQLIGGSFSVDFGNTAYVSEATAYDFGNGKSGYFTAGSLNAVIVPEPGAALLGGLGVLVLLRRRRVCGAV